MGKTIVKVFTKCPTPAELKRSRKISRIPFLCIFHVISVHIT